MVAMKEADKSTRSAARFHYGDRLLRPSVAAWLLDISPRTLKNWRQSAVRKGPPFVRLERNLFRYRVRDLRAYLMARPSVVAASPYRKRP